MNLNVRTINFLEFNFILKQYLNDALSIET
jgi:hypothetical protein